MYRMYESDGASSTPDRARFCSTPTQNLLLCFVHMPNQSGLAKFSDEQGKPWGGGWPKHDKNGQLKLNEFIEGPPPIALRT